MGHSISRAEGGNINQGQAVVTQAMNGYEEPANIVATGCSWDPG